MSCQKHSDARALLVRYGLASPESSDAEVERLTFEVGQRITVAVSAFAEALREIFISLQPAIEQFMRAVVELNDEVLRATVEVGNEDFGAKIEVNEPNEEAQNDQ